MKLNKLGMFGGLVASICLAGNVAASGTEKLDQGKNEYMNKCAVCHGQSGKGDGGTADILNVAPTDLTTLSKKNGGVFPFERVLMSIDGRQVVKGHGDRDMPIWAATTTAKRGGQVRTISMRPTTWKCMRGCGFFPSSTICTASR